MGKVIEFLKAIWNATDNQFLAETRYKEASQLRRELIEMRLERDYWKQRFEGLQEMTRAK